MGREVLWQTDRIGGAESAEGIPVRKRTDRFGRLKRRAEKSDALPVSRLSSTFLKFKEFRVVLFLKKM